MTPEIEQLLKAADPDNFPDAPTKPCKVSTCDDNAVAGGYCHAHQYSQSDRAVDNG